MSILVTGGCGFIGSHLVDRLIKDGYNVKVVDSAEETDYENPKATNLKADIVRDEITEHFEDVETVFHLAADPMVNTSAKNPKSSFEINVLGTFRVLEACRKKEVENIVFTSTSTVYGDAKIIPTPEDYSCKPISNYGASKLAGEAYVNSYSHSYGIKGTVLRLANIFGKRGNHGVMYDFFHKLEKNQSELEILGDGSQDKSYLYVSDCVEAILTTWKKQNEDINYFNVGSNNKINVNEIAKLMCKKLGINPKFKYTGGKRGWIGDVPLMLLDCTKLKKLGWEEKISFEEGLEKLIEYCKG